MPKLDQCVQHVTDSLKYSQDQIFLENTAQVPFPSVGSHETRWQPLLQVSYFSVYLQLEFPESNLSTKH